jgi:L-ascorbate metabolism protein UlaG (beta-lactamase superfamily)
VHALLTMQHLLTDLDPGGILTPHIQPLIARLNSLLGTAENTAEEIRRRVLIVGLGRRELKLAHFEKVGAALLRRKRLAITYFARGSGETTEREVSPQRLVYYRENWYLDAWCHLRNDIRNFALDSIRSAMSSKGRRAKSRTAASTKCSAPATAFFPGAGCSTPGCASRPSARAGWRRKPGTRSRRAVRGRRLLAARIPLRRPPRTDHGHPQVRRRRRGAGPARPAQRVADEAAQMTRLYAAAPGREGNEAEASLIAGPALPRRQPPPAGAATHPHDRNMANCRAARVHAKNVVPFFAQIQTKKVPHRSPTMKTASMLCALAAGALLAQPALAQNVKITPLGGQEGEFCPLDRALVFEDPSGTRVLYDPGRTVAGADDPRLGKIDVVLVSHMHGDHVGNAHNKAPNSGACDKPDTSVSAMPNSSAVNIAVAKGAKMVTGSEMAGFFGNKLKAAGGDPKNSVLARFGGSQKVGGVSIVTVTAIHSNALDPDLIGGVLGQYLKDAGIGAYVGEATGYVLKFSNGLVAYLSGDTGITGDQDKVVRGHYNAKLAVMNIGDTFTTGPAEAAYVINDLVKPNAVIASHANEVGTVGGKVRAGSRTETFIKASKVPVHVPLSGKTMEFNADGKCVGGC